MPMIWNEEANAKLLSAIIQVCDVKVAGDSMKQVAAMMGPECTPKAVTHQLAKIRSLAKTEPAAADGEDADGEQKNTTKAKKAPAKKNSKHAKPRTPSPGDDAEEYATPPDLTRPKRANGKRNYAAMDGENRDGEGNDEDDGLDKKVKIEVGEDVGEGLRSGLE